MKNKEIVIQGDSFKKARKMANQLLRKDEIITEIEIIDKGRKGILGFFKRPAVIKVCISSGNKVRGQNTKMADGMAAVVEGKLQIKDPLGSGKKAVVIPTVGAFLWVNGVPVRDPRGLGSDEDIEVELTETIQKEDLQIKLAENDLVAKVKIRPRVTVSYQLIDQPYQNVLQLSTKRYRREEKVIDVMQVEDALKDRGVLFGLDDLQLKKAVAASDGKWWVVARGESAIEGRDGFVEYLFKREPVEIRYTEEEWANFWERFSFPGVREGEVLAILHPPREGLPGKTVKGDEIPPRPVQEAILRVKDGVKVCEQGCKAIATTFGKPLLEGYAGKEYLKVVRQMIHPGDVDLKSGNLHFDGDLMILGNITEGMEVTAYGEITIMGDLVGAVVLAGRRVYCRGKIIDSKVCAGGLKALYQRIEYLLKRLEKILGWIIREAVRIREYSKYRKRFEQKDLNNIIRFLMENCHAELDKIIVEYVAVIGEEDIPVPAAIIDIINDIKYITSKGIAKGQLSLGQLNELLERIDETVQLLQLVPTHVCDIFCSYAQNSFLEASCNIFVIGQGCYQSSLVSGGEVRIDGSLRGGEVFATGDAFINEAGTPGKSVGKIKIKLSESATVFFNKVHPEAIVQIKNKKYIIEKSMSKIKLHLGAKKNIEINSI